MLSDYINKLAELLNSSILTPYNLLDNLDLENYLSVNYYKQDDYIVADIVFCVNNEQVTYRYLFDHNNFLQKIYHVNENKLILYFDRNQEKNNIIDEMKSYSNLRCV